MSIGIYSIQNTINSKRYIGKSESDISRRWEEHRTGVRSNRHLQNSINKYGLDNFKFKILEECEPKDCWLRERYWIKFYNSNNSELGYNKTNGGETKFGFKMSQEGIDRSKRVRKYNFVNRLTDYSHSEETKTKLKEAWNRRREEGRDKTSKETREKMSNSNLNTVFIYKELETKKVKRSVVHNYLYSGWMIGMNPKTNKTFTCHLS